MEIAWIWSRRLSEFPHLMALHVKVDGVVVVGAMEGTAGPADTADPAGPADTADPADLADPAGHVQIELLHLRFLRFHLYEYFIQTLPTHFSIHFACIK